MLVAHKQAGKLPTVQHWTLLLRVESDNQQQQGKGAAQPTCCVSAKGARPSGPGSFSSAPRGATPSLASYTEGRSSGVADSAVATVKGWQGGSAGGQQARSLQVAGRCAL